MPKTIDIMYLVPAAYRGRMVYGNGFAASDNLEPWEEKDIKEQLEDCQELRGAFVDVLRNIAPRPGNRVYKTVIRVTPSRTKTMKNPIRGAGMNARGGWRHATGSGVWLVKYASGPSFQIVRDGALYDLSQGRWSTKADSFKSAINLGRYKTLSEAQMAAHSARSRWRLGRRANPGPVSITATYKASDMGMHPVLDQALELANQLKGLPVPYVATRVLQLGGPARASVGLSLSFDPKESWPNGIFENSRHAKFSVNPEDGTIEQLTGWKVNKFRKARFKSSREALQKLAAWIQTATSTVKQNPKYADASGHKFKVGEEHFSPSWSDARLRKEVAFARDTGDSAMQALIRAEQSNRRGKNPISLSGAEAQWRRFADKASSLLDGISKDLRIGHMVDGSVFTPVRSYLTSLEECVVALKAGRNKEASAASAKLRNLEGRLMKLGVKRNPAKAGDLYDYETANYLRRATAAETRESVEASKHDGGAGAIRVDGRTCYVIPETRTKKRNPAADKPWALAKKSGWDDIVVGMYETREDAEAALRKKARYRPEHGDTPQSVGYIIAKTGRGTPGKAYYSVISFDGKKQLRINT
jgi:hypothetical protein